MTPPAGADVAERQATTADEDLVGRVEALERTNETLSQFAAVAAHDLRNPLGVVEGFAEILLDGDAGPLTPRQDEVVRKILAATGRMSDLIEDLLAFSRSSLAPHREAVDARTVVDQVLDALADVIATSGAVVDVGPLPVVVADPTQLSQVLQNLIANAVKFRSEEPPVVEVSARPTDGDRVEVSVADNGIGVPPDQAERIFQPFQRAAAGHEGAGIGLAVCARIVATHRGRIWVEPREEGGSVFRFTLPA